MTVGSGPYTYEHVENFARMPEGETIGLISRVTTDSQNRLYIFQRKDPAVLIFDKDGKLEIVIGSPGGPAIPAYVAKTIVALVDWKLTPAEAVGTANIVTSGDTLNLEQGTFLEKQAEAFKALGHTVKVDGSGSGLHAIRIMANGALMGGADPRREGAVKGE